MLGQGPLLRHFVLLHDSTFQPNTLYDMHKVIGAHHCLLYQVSQDNAYDLFRTWLDAGTHYIKLHLGMCSNSVHSTAYLVETESL